MPKSEHVSTHPVKSLSAKDQKVLEKLRAICMTFPAASERISHGEPCFFAGKGKVFAMFDNHHHGAAHVGVWLPQPVGVQAELIEAEPSVFFRPPYVGPSGWVGVILDRKPDWGMVAGLIDDAYRHVAGKKLIAELDARGAGASRPSARSTRR